MCLIIPDTQLDGVQHRNWRVLLCWGARHPDLCSFKSYSGFADVDAGVAFFVKCTCAVCGKKAQMQEMQIFTRVTRGSLRPGKTKRWPTSTNSNWFIWKLTFHPKFLKGIGRLGSACRVFVLLVLRAQRLHECNLDQRCRYRKHTADGKNILKMVEDSVCMTWYGMARYMVIPKQLDLGCGMAWDGMEQGVYGKKR